MTPRRKVLILGAAGRDFHNFHCVFREDSGSEVVAFTATQIPGIAGRVYPPALAGPLYPSGIPIVPEREMDDLIRREGIAEVVFSYSDVSHAHVMHLASRATAAGADFRLLGASATMLPAPVPVISVCAVRTGAGKSQTTRRIARLLREAGRRISVVRHPMPYGDLVAMRVQRLATMEDLVRHRCTIEEREEYEHHIAAGSVVWAGVDYHAILEEARKECDVLLWDGGNNDTPFYRSDLEIVVADPLRPGHELGYWPGEANFRRAGVILINKVDTARPEDLETVRRNAREANPGAIVIEAASEIRVDDEASLRGRRVLVVEDGPTLTHGEMAFGAGTVAARRFGAGEIMDPRPWAVGTIAETFAKYPATGALLPAMGYGDAQVRDLEETIRRVPCDIVVIGTPIDLRKIVKLDKPSVRVFYSLREISGPTLDELVSRFLASR